MAHPIRKIYKPNSCGGARREARLTLTAIKKQIRNSENSTQARRRFHKQGLLGSLVP